MAGAGYKAGREDSLNTEKLGHREGDGCRKADM